MSRNENHIQSSKYSHVILSFFVNDYFVCPISSQAPPLSHQQCPYPQEILPCLVQLQILHPEKQGKKHAGLGGMAGLNMADLYSQQLLH